MSGPLLKIPILCTDSCRQMSCTCCSSNVRVNNWEKRTVHYCAADNELQSAPEPTWLDRLLSFCCCYSLERTRKDNARTFNAVNIYLEGNYQVNISQAATDSRISIAPFRKGKKPMKMRDFEALKGAAQSISKERSTSSESTDDSAVPAENLTATRVRKRPRNLRKHRITQRTEI